MKGRMRAAFFFLCLCSLGTVGKGFSQSTTVEHPPSRWNISLGLGAGLHTAPFLVDYMNAFRQSQSAERLDDFSSMIEFFVTPEYRLAPEWSIALEYGLLTKSQTVGGGEQSAGSQFAYNVHMPSAIVHHVVDGSSYILKFGGGVGYHVATLQQSLYAFGVEENYTASGVGVKLEAVGNTKFDETFYGAIGVDLRWGFLGAFENAGGAEAFERATNTTARMQFFSLSLRFGVMFQL